MPLDLSPADRSRTRTSNIKPHMRSPKAHSATFSRASSDSPLVTLPDQHPNPRASLDLEPDSGHQIGTTSAALYKASPSQVLPPPGAPCTVGTGPAITVDSPGTIVVQANIMSETLPKSANTNSLPPLKIDDRQTQKVAQIPKSTYSNGFISSLLNAAQTAITPAEEVSQMSPDQGSALEGLVSSENDPVDERQITRKDSHTHHSTFSSKLDFLLKPAKHTHFSKSTSSNDGTEYASNPSKDSVASTTAEEAKNEADALKVHPASGVEFQSIRESPLKSLGNGNLTLDDILEDIPGKSAITNQGKGSVRPMSREGTVNQLSRESTMRPVSREGSTRFPMSRSSSINRSMSPDVPSRRSINPLRRRALSNATSQAPSNTGSDMQLGISKSNNRLRSSLVTVSDGETSSLDNLNTNDTGDLSKYAPDRRDRAFHQLFRKVSTKEHLIHECSCALSKDILVHGRMYISDKNICFNSNILGWVTNLTIPLQEVIQIEKKSTAVLFPNGIVIRTLHHKYVFATFMSREAVFDTITKVWQRGLKGLLDTNGETILRKGRIASRSVGKEGTPLFVNSDSSVGYDEDDDFSENSQENESNNESSSGISDDDDSDDLKDLSDGGPGDDNESKSEEGGKGKSESSSGGLPSIGPTKHDATEFQYEKDPNDVFITDEVLKAPLGVIYSLLFGTDSSYYVKILKHQKNFDISEVPGLSAKVKDRKYSYIKPLSGPIGPKQTKCLIEDRVINYDLEKYIQVEQVTQTPDVPSGGSFKVKTQIFLCWASNNNTRIYVVTSIEWLAKSWIKGAIEKGSIDGQKSSMKLMIEALGDMIDSELSKGSKEKSKRRRSRQNTRSRKDTMDSGSPEPPRVVSEQQSIPRQIQQLLDLVGNLIPIRIPFVGLTISGALVSILIVVLSIQAFYFTMYCCGFEKLDRSKVQVDFGSPELAIKRVNINGQHYMMVPDLETEMRDPAVRLRNERKLWGWLEEKSGNRLHVSSGSDHSEAESKREEPKAYAKQEQREVVRAIQARIDRLRNELDMVD